jgi:putative colanic acid biosynthesis acetyltransferase WcaF
MGDHRCLADGVDCYCVASITLGAHAIVSQRAFLCAATHDHNDPAFPLIPKPISIGERAWVAAEAFVGPGVTIGVGAVVGARAVTVKDVAEWTVVAGNPARVIGRRKS